MTEEDVKISDSTSPWRPPLISICIPTYNRAPLLDQVLDALTAQIIDLQNDDLEVIVSDNCSEDHTPEVVASYQARCPCLKSLRNERNVGPDDNTILSFQAAVGEYVWFCSDDDIPLPGTLAKIFKVITDYHPKLIFLNHTGYLEGEDYRVVYDRNPDSEDVVYHDGEAMLLKHMVNHFSATILRRRDAVKFLPVVEDHKRRGFDQGYARTVLSHYLLLDRKVPGPCVYVGKNCLAVRNPKTVHYDPIKVVLIDLVTGKQLLAANGFLSRKGEQTIVNGYLHRMYRVLIPLKIEDGRRHLPWPRVVKLCRLLCRYPKFYTHILPILLTPRWVLKIVYPPASYFYHLFLRLKGVPAT